MDSRLDALRGEVCRYARRILPLGLAPNTQGNLSARDPETGLIAMTPHDYPYDIMRPEDILLLDLDGRVVEGHLGRSNETAVHCFVYRERPQVNGVVHTEPLYANCFGVVGKPILPIVVVLAVEIGSPVPVMPFMRSGSADFGKEMLKVMGECPAIIWANHGLLTIGETLDQAFRRTIAVETGAHIYHLALQIGTPRSLTNELMPDFIA